MQVQTLKVITKKLIGDQLKAIEANRLDTQKLAFEVPMGEGLNMYDNYHEAYTGFDKDGNFTGAVDPGTAAVNAIPDYGAGGDEGAGGSNYDGPSVFDDGGAAGGKG